MEIKPVTILMERDPMTNRIRARVIQTTANGTAYGSDLLEGRGVTRMEKARDLAKCEIHRRYGRAVPVGFAGEWE